MNKIISEYDKFFDFVSLSLYKLAFILSDDKNEASEAVSLTYLSGLKTFAENKRMPDFKYLADILISHLKVKDNVNLGVAAAFLIFNSGLTAAEAAEILEIDFNKLEKLMKEALSALKR